MASPIPPSQPIPLERSILWVPASSRTGADGHAEYHSVVMPGEHEESPRGDIPSVSEESPRWLSFPGSEATEESRRSNEIPRSARNDSGARSDKGAHDDLLIEDHAIFISQDALREIAGHARSSAGDDVLGFLLGERYECPDSGAHYAVITTVVRTGHVIAETDLVQIPDEEWLGIQLEVRRRHLTLIGWYHTAPFVALNPSRWDVETQRARFAEPWQCGLVVATGERAAGGFFRAWSSASGAPSGTGDALAGAASGAFVPFHELLDDASLSADGVPRTLINWRNYVTDADVERDALDDGFASFSGPSAPSGPTTPVLFPTGWNGDDTSALPPRRPRRTRPWRIAALAILVVAAIVAWSLWSRGGSGNFESSASAPPDSAAARASAGHASRTASTASGDVRSAPRAPGTTASPGASPSQPSPSSTSASSSAALTNPSLLRFNRLADSLQQATVNYHTRRADFDLQRIDCTGLARGYRAADDALVALAALYREVHGLLSSAQIARFENLGASMDTLNGDFDKSGCPRP